MKRVLAASLFVLVLSSQPALAWDPWWDDFDPGPVDRAPDPEPFVVPEGLYEVTDVYAGDVVTTTGATTTYSTETVHETPGTFARIVDVVETGRSSAYDGASFNDRAVTSAGESVAGTYYEDFVLTSSGFVSVNIVFFEDDSVTRRAAGPTPAPTSGPVAAASPQPAPSAPPVASAPPVVPAATAAPVVIEREPPTSTPVPRTGTAGIALGPTAGTLRSIEVLRGRHVALWPRAFVDGVAVPIATWRLASGTVSGTCAMGGSAPSCDAYWLALAPAGSAWRLRFEVTTSALPGQVMTATLDVIVRSPALEQ